jgi:hypothetical protein
MNQFDGSRHGLALCRLPCERVLGVQLFDEHGFSVLVVSFVPGYLGTYRTHGDNLLPS